MGRKRETCQVFMFTGRFISKHHSPCMKN
uniref:FHA domain-containing protein n=1 Tax=Anguilla anguilla TaxID=7936 RepID=A0A0E9P9Y4_ANGAN